MVTAAPVRSPFLDLPLEIREQVYGGLFSDSTCKTVQMLRTSQQIYAEAQAFLYKRPLAFASQFDMYDWIKKSTPQNLRYVQCIRIRLVDVIGHEGLDTSKIQDYRKSCPSPITRSYEEDLQRFASALKSVPNVRSLTLYKHRAAESDHFREYHRACFNLITRQSSGLRSLSFYVHQVPLDFLPALRSLQSLRFTGFSTSTPKDTLTYLRKLPALEEMELFGPPPGLAFHQRRGYIGPKTVQSLSADVVRGLTPLKSFTICEMRDSVSGVDEVFAEPVMLHALAQTHGKSLRKLRISTDFLPSPASRNALMSLLAASAIQTLELGWPGLDGRVVDVLPPSIRCLQITVGGALPPDELVARLVARRAQLASLAEVVIRTDWRDPSGNQLSAKVDAALARLKAMGVKASRGKWYPIILDCTD